MKHPETDDTNLNMTPMIDIVFQLILFFLFSLRFKALENRIDTQLPKDRGGLKTYEFPPPIEALRVSLVRERPEDAASGTKIKLAGFEFFAPHAADAGNDARRDEVFRSLQAKMVALNPRGELKGRIDVRPPKGDAVPHADVVRVIDSFLGAGVRDVAFEGARNPMPHGPSR